MAYSPNNNLGISPAPNGGISPQKNNLHKMARTPNPNHPANIFDNHLFCLDSTAEDTVSRPYIPALPVMHSSASPRMNGAHARSVSLPHNSASPVYRSETPDSSFNYYRSQQYLDPRSSLSPPPHENSGNTTPGFETLDDLPEGFPDELFGRINSLPMAAANNLPTVNIPETEILAAGLVPNSAGSSGYLPSPRQTASPYSHPFSPKVTISRSPSGRRYCSPAVKVEHRSPDIHHQNIPYFNHRSSSSSSSGIAPDSTTIHRGDDGSWHGGIDPLHRDSEYLPFSLKEQEFEEVRRAKNADVEEWLHRSAMQLPRPSGGLALPKDTGRKRAKSLSDFRSSPAIIDGKVVVPGEADAAEDDDEDDLEDDDDSSVATLDSTYQEGSLDEPPENGIKQQPTSEEDIHMANLDEVEREQKERENDPSLHPRPGQFFSAHPWNDIVGPVSRGASMAHRNQPGSSNYAITKFLRYAENIETASRVATYGSSMTKGRRNSTGGLELLPGPLKRLSFGRDKDKEKEKEKKNGAATPRRPSIWGGFTSGIKRSLSNSGDKAKLDKSKLQSPTDNGRKRGSSFSGSSSPFMQGILGPTFGQPGEASGVAGAFAQMASPLMAAGAAANQAASTSPGVVGGVIERVRRSRSKSDLQRKHIFGVVTSLVGPALSGGSPSPSPPEQAPGNLVKKFTFGEETQKRGNADVQRLLSPDDAHTNRAPDDDEDMEDGDLSPLSARTPGGTKTQLPKHDIVPTLDGFVQNVRTLTPGLSGKLVDRIAHEQVKRFKKLVDHRHKHLAALKAGGTCSNGSKCRKVFGAIGVGSDGFVGVSGHKRGNNSFDAGDDFGLFPSPRAPEPALTCPRFIGRERALLNRRRQCSRRPIPARRPHTPRFPPPCRIRMPHLLQNQTLQQTIRLDQARARGRPALHLHLPHMHGAKVI